MALNANAVTRLLAKVRIDYLLNEGIIFTGSRENEREAPSFWCPFPKLEEHVLLYCRTIIWFISVYVSFHPRIFSV